MKSDRYRRPHGLLTELSELGEELCREVAYDLPFECYVLLRRQIPSLRPASCFSAVVVDAQFYEANVRRWRGVGLLAVVNERNVMSLARSSHSRWCKSTGEREDLGPFIRAEFYTLLAHELAHFFQLRPIEHELPNADDVIPKARAAMMSELSKEAIVGPCPWEIGGPHGARFIRIALHVCQRFRERSVPFFRDVVCAGPLYGLSSTDDYAFKLGRELNWHRRTPISRILEEPPPEELHELWEADVRSHFLKRL